MICFLPDRPVDQTLRTGPRLCPIQPWCRCTTSMREHWAFEVRSVLSYLLFRHGPSAQQVAGYGSQTCLSHPCSFDDNVFLRAEIAHKVGCRKHRQFAEGSRSFTTGMSEVGRKSCRLTPNGFMQNMYIKDDSAAKRTRTVGAYGGASSYGAPPAPGRPVGYAPVSNVKDNPPCNTLFVGNLGDTVDEGELTALFSTQPVGLLTFPICSLLLYVSHLVIM